MFTNRRKIRNWLTPFILLHWSMKWSLPRVQLNDNFDLCKNVQQNVLHAQETFYVRYVTSCVGGGNRLTKISWLKRPTVLQSSESGTVVRKITHIFAHYTSHLHKRLFSEAMCMKKTNSGSCGSFETCCVNWLQPCASYS